ncbi:YkgJ family cysteine cluster protein [Nitrosopumilus sp.]|uniref:YkgJ family cysteine cluster protein n=1 Tax=Nitrosopumilus sp. TaxID=2024843 RepID=UPI002619A19D|nr:YkgJ family cysteine cluster protein [Nitrosopumilus sp.]
MFESLCGKCDHKNCCTNSAVPLVFQDDLKKLKNIDPNCEENLKFVNIDGVNVSAIKKKTDSLECIYWDAEMGGCTVYDGRPMDCRLYPFDILFLNGSYHWIVYSCNDKSDWKWSETHLSSLESEDGFPDLMRNIELFSKHTDMILPNESEKTPYVVLRKVSWNSK